MTRSICWLRLFSKTFPCSLALLASRWGRWRDILAHARCKRRLGERDVETICRVILVFCLLHYRGDENIKSFIWELITPPENGREPQTLLNHSGTHTHTHTHIYMCIYTHTYTHPESLSSIITVL